MLENTSAIAVWMVVGTMVIIKQGGLDPSKTNFD
jgi:hypothetical protein